MKPADKIRVELVVCFSSLIIFDPEDGSDMFLRNVELSRNYTALTVARASNPTRLKIILMHILF
jgi:hypothetical protein